MASFKKSTSGWRAQIERLGIRKSKTFPTKAAAQAWATKEEAAILAGARGEIPHHSLREALDRYAREVSPSKRGVRWEIIRLASFARTMPFADQWLHRITPNDIGQWRDLRLVVVKRSSVRRDFNLLKAVFNRAIKEWRWLESSPMRDVAMPDDEKPRTRRIHWREVLAICRALGYKDGEVETKSQEVALAFLLSLRTAMRAGEILSLSDTTVDLERRVAMLCDTKNGDDRTVPLTKRAARLLRSVSGRGKLFSVNNATRDALFRRACRKAGVLDLHFHDARAEALTRLSRRVDVMTLARISGHRDLKILMQTYYRETAEQIAARL